MFKDKVKASIDIVDLIGQTVELKQVSEFEWTGATSPDSKSGKSLHVKTDIQVWNDLSGRATPSGGDCFSWIAYVNNLNVKKDFTETLRIAAEYVDIPFEGVNVEKVAEVRKIQDYLTEAAEIYHEQLTDEMRSFITSKWGITDKTIDNLKIGYAKIGSNLPNANVESGLFTCVNEKFLEFFQGRIIFPYWKNGRVVNFVARGAEIDKNFKPKNQKEWELLKTPLEKWETGKYKKLLTHNEEHDFVHESVNNCYLLGEDSLRKKDYCVITEGVADAIVLMQNGFPCVSPVTVQFAKHDHEQLIAVCKGLKSVYICNDNEDSGAGEKGAIKTATLLRKAGINIKLITLPRKNNSKIDIAEYFLKNDKDDFNTLIKESKEILTYLLSKVEKSSSKKENIDKAKIFVTDVLNGLPDTDEFINYDLKDYFNFTEKDLKFVKSTQPKTIDTEDKIHVPFDVVGDIIKSGFNIITMNDTKEIYLYNNGVYSLTGALSKLDKAIREEYSNVWMDEWERRVSKGRGIEPNHIPVGSTAFVKEVLNYISVYTIVNRKDIDENPEYKHLINFKNGILNFNTLEFIPHDPKYKLIRQIPLTYNPEAKCPNIRNFLSDVVKDEDSQVLLEFLGYSLIPDTRFAQGVMLQGEGSNGKSIFLSLLRTFMGEENLAAIEMQDLGDDKFAAAELYGKLVNVFPDMSSEEIKNTGKFKAISSGDMVNAQKKFGQPFKFKNYSRQIYSCNKMPFTKDQSYAFFRRILLIDFPYTFCTDPKKIGEKKEDKKILDKITTEEELSGLLNLALTCARQMVSNGKYSYNLTVEAVAEHYMLKSDPIQVFMNKYTEISENNISKTDLYYAYEQWATLKRIEVVSPIKFTKRLKNMGISTCRPYDGDGSRQNVWENISLTEDFKNMPAWNMNPTDPVETPLWKEQVY
jgi:P4 family phage/plasmid primase-like protien